MKNTSLLTTLMVFASGMVSTAQSPDLYPPTVPEPVENPVLYIVLTLAIIAIYLIYRNSQNKRRKKDKQQNKK